MRIDNIPDSPGRTRNATRTAHHTSHLGAYPVPSVSGSVRSLEGESDSSKSAPSNKPASSSFSSAARARSRSDMASTQSRPNIFPSFGSSSCETSQQVRTYSSFPSCHDTKTTPVGVVVQKQTQITPLRASGHYTSAIITREATFTLLCADKSSMDAKHDDTVDRCLWSTTLSSFRVIAAGRG